MMRVSIHDIICPGLQTDLKWNADVFQSDQESSLKSKAFQLKCTQIYQKLSRNTSARSPESQTTPGETIRLQNSSFV